MSVISEVKRVGYQVFFRIKSAFSFVVYHIQFYWRRIFEKNKYASLK